MSGYSKLERETCINMNDEEAVAIISTYQRVWIRRLLALAQEDPDNVNIIKQDGENYIEVSFPKKYVKIRPPRKMSEEQREQARLRFAKIREKSAEESTKDDEDSIDDDTEYEDDIKDLEDDD